MKVKSGSRQKFRREKAEDKGVISKFLILYVSELIEESERLKTDSSIKPIMTHVKYYYFLNTSILYPGYLEF